MNVVEGARVLPLRHVSVRVPWHDTDWTGKVCARPGENTACLIIDNIQKRKDDAAEAKVAGRSIFELEPAQQPPCLAERVAFMSPTGYQRYVQHPYHRGSKLYAHYRPTPLRVPAYGAECVPFRWLRRDDALERARKLSLHLEDALEPTYEAMWGYKGRREDGKSDYVQHARNQEVMLDTFFSAVRPNSSLVFFYAKRSALSDESGRVLIGVSRVKHLGSNQEYEYEGGHQGQLRSVLFERPLQHGLGERDGVMLPYHALLEAAKTDGSIDTETLTAFVPDESFWAFSYVTEHVDHDQAIGALLAIAATLRRIAQVLPGDFERDLAWIDREINRLWQMRGPFPGLDSALCAMGLAQGTLIAHDLAAAQEAAGSEWNEDPWPLVEAALADPAANLSPGVASCIQPLDHKKWSLLPPERRALLKLLARFPLDEPQAELLFQREARRAASIDVDDAALLANPYLVYERARRTQHPVPLNAIDRGVFPDEVVRAKHPVPSPSAMQADIDPRRVRAFLVERLERAAATGHTLLPLARLLEQVRTLELSPRCPIGADTWPLVQPELAPELVEVKMADGKAALQLARYLSYQRLVRRTLGRRLSPRARRHVADHDWRRRVDDALGTDPGVDPGEARARSEKAAALAELFAARASVLIGAAGTGKTTLLRLLCELPEVQSHGLLLLAPTGKARVCLQRATELSAQTVAQFLLKYDRYAPTTGIYAPRPGAERAQGIGTVIIDEASMLTEDQLAAILDAVSMPERVVLAGDPRQLPPIGAGRPFVDLVRQVMPDDVATIWPKVAPGYAHLTESRRHAGSRERHDLQLAAWFTGDPIPPDGDAVWSVVAHGVSDRVKMVRWHDAADLREKLFAELRDELGLASVDDEKGFDQTLGAREPISDDIPYVYTRLGAGEHAENWQILGPVHRQGHGIDELNRLVQHTFRAAWKRYASRSFRRRDGSVQRKCPAPMGPEGIIYGDKVIQLRNQRRKYVWPKDGALRYVANGEIGIAVGEYVKRPTREPWRLKVEFATQPGHKYSYTSRDFASEAEPVLALAYALTIHKAQGSEFGTTFVVLPEPCFLLSRELLYTALTRHKDRLVILHQGEAGRLRDYFQRSETARRVTNLFVPPELVADDDGWFEAGLIHRTVRGELVRSKSELAIADLLHARGLDYRYEQALIGPDGTRKLPDFTVADNGLGQKVVWEHLGLLHDPSYEARWRQKLAWYRDNGFLDFDRHPDGGDAGVLVVTRDDERGGLDMQRISGLVEDVFG